MNLRVLHSGNLASVGRNLCLGLRRAGIGADLVYAAYSDSMGLLEKGDREWTTLVDARRSRALGYMDRLELVFGWRLTRNIDLGQYEILHLHSVMNPINMGLSVRNLLQDRLPVILHYHGSVSSKVRGTRHTLRSYLLRRDCEIVLCSTPNILANVAHLPQKKVFLPNPVDTTAFRPDVCREDRSRQVLCWVKLEAAKGIETILEAARLLPEYEFHFPNVSLTGEQMHYLARKAPNVRFIPRVSHSAAPDLICRYPMVLGQFKLGSFGVSELEVMSCGKPLVAYWNEDFNVHYEEPSPILSSTDPEEIAQLIEDHASDVALGRRLRNWVEKYHSVDVVAGRLIGIYREVMEA